MKTYKYKAKKGLSEISEGTLVAHTKDEAINTINDMGLFPVEILEVGASSTNVTPLTPTPYGRKVKTRDLIFFFRQLGRMIQAGTPILKALVLIAEETDVPALNQFLTRTTKDIREGRDLSASLAQFTNVFSPLDIAMIRSGEHAGKMDEVLMRLAEYREQRALIEGKIRQSLAYPLFVVTVGVGTVVFMMMYVIPQFSRFFDDLGQELPLMTKMLLTSSSWLQQYWIWLAIGFVSGLLVLINVAKRADFKAWWSRFILSTPKIGTLLMKSECSRFARTLQVLLKSGVSLLVALGVTTPVLKNETIRAELERARRKLKDGGYLSDSLRDGELLPRFVCNMIKTGEESGKLDTALSEVADWYEYDVKQSIQVMTSLLEPIIILLIGLCLGFIVIAVLLPILSMNALV